MKVSEHIYLHELVPKDIYKMEGDAAIKHINSGLPILLERIRELCGGRTMILNNWYWGGKYQYRVFRPDSYKLGAKLSMHRKGMAADFDIEGMTAPQVRDIIRKNADELMELGLTRIEINVGWVHIDMKLTGHDKLVEFKP